MEFETIRILLTGLFTILMLFLFWMFYTGFYRMALIYNWNGKRYCYLGYVPIRREKDGFALRIGEHMVDLSRTTSYRICMNRTFCRKNRYRDLFVYADSDRRHVVIDGEIMKTEIPF